jgi:hypothetical protein
VAKQLKKIQASFDHLIESKNSTAGRCRAQLGGPDERCATEAAQYSSDVLKDRSTDYAMVEFQDEF